MFKLYIVWFLSWCALKLGAFRAIFFCEGVSIFARISPRVRFGKGVGFIGDVTIASDVKIGKGTYIQSGLVRCADIGEYCSISYDVVIGPSEHVLDEYTTSPYFARKYYGNSSLADKAKQKVTISDEVLIGAKVIILQGVSIGEGAVVGAGSVVTRDIPSYEIWAGVPAKFIRHRTVCGLKERKS